MVSNIIRNCYRSLWVEQTDRAKLVNNTLDNGAGPDAATHGIRLSVVGQINDITIRGNTISSHQTGIQFDTGGTYGGKVIVENNDFVSVATPIGNTNASAAATNYWRNNEGGWNPVGRYTGSGGLPSTPAVPASGTAQTNISQSDVTVYITANSGGTTAVSIGGQSTGVTIAASGNAQFRLPVGQTITLTYASAPTWTWFGD